MNKPGFAGLRRHLWDALRLFGGLIALAVVGIAVSPRLPDHSVLFLNQRNLFDILARVSNVGILAVGMTIVILTGGIDLSVGSLLSLGTVIAAMLLLERGWNNGSKAAVPSLAFAAGTVAVVAWRAFAGRTREKRGAGWSSLALFVAVAGITILWAIAAIRAGMPVAAIVLSAMAVGLVVGCLNGVLIAFGGLQPFIATLASMISIWGLAYWITGESNARRSLSTGEGAPRVLESFAWLGSRVGNVVPVPGLFFVGVVVIAHVVLRYTELGRRIYAIGGNEEAARLSGIPVSATKVLVYGASGLLSALTGVLWAAQYSQGFPDAGQGAELDAIAAVVIGGTSLMGGRGGIPGTFMGVLMFGVLANILMLRESSTNIQRLVTGVVIIAAVLLQEGRLRQSLVRWLAALKGAYR